MDVDENQKTDRQWNAERKKKDAAAIQAIVDGIVARSTSSAPDRPTNSNQTARAVSAERKAFAKPNTTAPVSGAGSQQRSMHSGSTRLRTPAAIMIEKSVTQDAQEEPVVEDDGNQATRSAVPDHSMPDAEERAATRKNRIWEFKQFAARVEKSRQLKDAARAQTKQDDADAEFHMLLAAELDKQVKQDLAAQEPMVEDPVPSQPTPKNAMKTRKDAVELPEITELLDALSTMEQTNSQSAISLGFPEAPRSSVVLPAEKLIIGNMIQSENHPRAPRISNARTTPFDQRMGDDLFTHPQMTLSDAAAQIQTYLNAARGVTSRWCELGKDHFSQSLSDPLLQRHIEELTRDLCGSAIFLSRGRLGWELHDLPRNIFEEAGLLLPELRTQLTSMSQCKGGERLIGALKATEEIDATKTWMGPSDA
ncbi:uncharacterized protein MYCFIDRAFT_76000 [Pseudocercospora fijiensis CIRAD86]|uniref:Uncharacterized protein n=1 Tax=Pseudocercospora fijiensis (strain CIRAD86) TaxID=383855 RepID=N1QAY4_PSEFD|nr:uncharacterized protein MYCFIDRAFT_76000 [Pseudocercospora fijiensis CIRAD86]EME88168.1 hypothetical protein MYCFIDRAFT_76000 [Pseudocercospora fijiensis CIRAD86]